jgi:integrase
MIKLELEYNITYRRKDKGWQYIVSRKENGKWKQVKSKQGFKTKSDAKPVAENMLEVLKKEDSNKKNIVNNDYNSINLKELFELFIEHNKIYKEPKTISTYEDSKYNFQKLWDMKVIDIKRIHVQNVIDELTQKGLKRSTIKLNLSKFKLALTYYKNNYDNNYSLSLDTIALPKQIKEEKRALTKSQLDQLLVQIKDNEAGMYYIAALLAGYCGLRIGEILGLTWSDFDENEMTLKINKQWKLDKNGDENFGKLKSNNAYRNLAISPKVIAALKKYKKASVTDLNNRIIVAKPQTFQTAITHITSKYMGVSIHELRHTYATILIGNGIDFKTIAKLLGHDVAQTIETYSHVNDDMLKNAIDKIKNIF